jgi:uncharacterized protein YecE (DUF72 family)
MTCRQANGFVTMRNTFTRLKSTRPFIHGRPWQTLKPGGVSRASETSFSRSKPCELITHIKRFRGTKTLIKDFGMIADILGDRMGCFLFQLPPSHRYTKARLSTILSQLDPARRNVVEFRHVSWWNETVYAAFRRTGTIFCSCSGPRLPDELVRTADDVYLRLHGPERWYRHNYSRDELSKWANKITASGAKRVWVYFNNDHEAHAPRNAVAMRRLLVKSIVDLPAR